MDPNRSMTARACSWRSKRIRGMRFRLCLATVVASLFATGALSTNAAAQDAYGCFDNYFCLYDGDNFTSLMVQYGASYTGSGWWNLGSYEYRTNSVRNRRDRDSLLGDNAWNRYCSDSHSSDATLSNNAIGNNSAVIFANVSDDGHC